MTAHLFSLLVAAALAIAAGPAAAASKHSARKTDAAHRARHEPSAVFRVGPDLAGCAAGACGGYLVSEAGRPLTRCADGSTAAQCPVARLEPSGGGAPDADTLAELALAPPDRRSLVAGTIEAAAGKSAGAVLRVTKAWRAAGEGAEEGSLFSVRDSGIRCVKPPCPTIRATLVGGDTEILVAEVDLERAKASPADVDEAADALASEGILVAGAPAPGPTADIDVLLASRFYLRVPASSPCEDAGARCSGR